ncbi:MAG: type VI secretion system baseplate subunit TssG, partial [Syntrophales bacterium LBB04]|nr:type VI secretion system baseplate subunit TssG [Syntrophales bacterium LBB04]
MKWLFVCLAVFFMVAPAMAGEDPYIATVGDDYLIGQQFSFYFSPKYQQFMYNQAAFAVPVCVIGATIPAANGYLRFPPSPVSGCESFFSQTPTIQAEVCDLSGTGTGPQGALPPFYYEDFLEARGANAKTPAGNSGWYEWWIRLPKKPSGEIN